MLASCTASATDARKRNSREAGDMEDRELIKKTMNAVNAIDELLRCMERHSIVYCLAIQGWDTDSVEDVNVA